MSVSLVSLEPAQCQAHREDRRESLSTAFIEGWKPKTCFPRELQTMPFSSPAFVCSQVTNWVCQLLGSPRVCVGGQSPAACKVI